MLNIGENFNKEQDVCGHKMSPYRLCINYKIGEQLDFNQWSELMPVMRERWTV